MAFDYSLDFKNIDFRKHPEFYRVGKDEQSVLLVEPYKSEILPHWRFKTPEAARKSAREIYKMFLDYKAGMTLSAWIWLARSCKWVTPGFDRLNAHNLRLPGYCFPISWSLLE